VPEDALNVEKVELVSAVLAGRSVKDAGCTAP